ncbi:hypothetical protein BJ170DRAFT_590678 [Xylariales sp. AK1849]|nr:hypothetical protein BJ170DRAFT_590678 [Xylariales sp. AK1849]
MAEKQTAMQYVGFMTGDDILMVPLPPSPNPTQPQRQLRNTFPGSSSPQLLSVASQPSENPPPSKLGSPSKTPQFGPRLKSMGNSRDNLKEPPKIFPIDWFQRHQKRRQRSKCAVKFDDDVLAVVLASSCFVLLAHLSAYSISSPSIPMLHRRIWIRRAPKRVANDAAVNVSGKPLPPVLDVSNSLRSSIGHARQKSKCEQAQRSRVAAVASNIPPIILARHPSASSVDA